MAQDNLDLFCFKRILMNDTERKMIAIEGNFTGLENPAVLVMEKFAFDKETALNVCDMQTKLKRNVDNDAYKSFSCVPPHNGKCENYQSLYLIFNIDSN